MRTKCGGLTFHQGHCCAGLFSPNKALEDIVLACFTSSTCNIPPSQGSMYLLTCMPQTDSVISPVQTAYMSFTAHYLYLPVGGDGITHQGRRKRPWKMECPQQCCSALKPTRLGKWSCNQQRQRLEFKCPSRIGKQMNKLAAVLSPPADLSESTLHYLQ